MLGVACYFMDTTNRLRAAIAGQARSVAVGRVLDFTELQRICTPVGPLPRVATVRRWADRQGIRYKADGRGGIWTTLEALNTALGLGGEESQQAPLEDLI